MQENRALPPGAERYGLYRSGENQTRIHYYYKHKDGSLFHCVKPTLKHCRAARDAWLGKGTEVKQ